MGDGSIISITSNGTLQQHFGGTIDEISEQVYENDLSLASDIALNNNRNMSDLITTNQIGLWII